MAGVTKTTNINSHARELDFVTRFATNFNALLQILGITRPIRKTPGTKLVGTVADITLENGNVAEGETIPMSVANVHDVEYGDVSIEKYAKAVTIEAVNKYGADKAVTKTDDALLAKLQNIVSGRFYDFLATGLLTNVAPTFQMAIAMSQAYVREVFSALNLDITDIVGFVNVIDAFQYLGAAEITTQQAFGMTYVENFMGYRILFLCDSTRVPRGKVFATPIENIVSYYVDPSDSDFAKMGLDYTVAGETPFVGFHTQGNYSNATGETYAIMGLYLFAEYLNGVANITVQASGSLGTVTVASAAGAETGDSKVTVTYTAGVGEKLYYKEGASAVTPTYLDTVDLAGWTEIAVGESNIAGLTSGQTLSVVAVNGTGQAMASGSATIVVK